MWGFGGILGPVKETYSQRWSTAEPPGVIIRVLAALGVRIDTIYLLRASLLHDHAPRKPAAAVHETGVIARAQARRCAAARLHGSRRYARAPTPPRGEGGAPRAARAGLLAYRRQRDGAGRVRLAVPTGLCHGAWRGRSLGSGRRRLRVLVRGREARGAARGEGVLMH